ncbi:MAG: tail fiber protein [Arsenophonus sp. NC-WZS1-MAG3]
MKRVSLKLSNVNQSSSKTEAAISKTVKIVNDRLNAVVDYTFSNLDTLNKLSQAISNNPKFFKSVTQFLNEKLAKNKNGVRHPRQESFFKKPSFIRNCKFV